MQIEGELIEIYDTEQVSERFRKREFVVEYTTNPDYPQFIKFELVQDRCVQVVNMDRLVGDVVAEVIGLTVDNPALDSRSGLSLIHI
mgnify:CR=1 FL=1